MSPITSVEIDWSLDVPEKALPCTSHGSLRAADCLEAPEVRSAGHGTLQTSHLRPRPTSTPRTQDRTAQHPETMGNGVRGSALVISPSDLQTCISSARRFLHFVPKATSTTTRSRPASTAATIMASAGRPGFTCRTPIIRDVQRFPRSHHASSGMPILLGPRHGPGRAISPRVGR